MVVSTIDTEFGSWDYACFCSMKLGIFLLDIWWVFFQKNIKCQAFKLWAKTDLLKEKFHLLALNFLGK